MEFFFNSEQTLRPTKKFQKSENLNSENHYKYTPAKVSEKFYLFKLIDNSQLARAENLAVN